MASERADACRELIKDLEREVLFELHRWVVSGSTDDS